MAGASDAISSNIAAEVAAVGMDPLAIGGVPMGLGATLGDGVDGAAGGVTGEGEADKSGSSHVGIMRV